MKLSNQFPSIEQVSAKYLNQKASKAVSGTEPAVSFDEILKTKQEAADGELKFSKHAAFRLTDRNISLTDNQMERLESGTKKASEKGIRESLIIVDQMAFIVNTKSQTVITAMDQEETSDNIFTNIDGAVIM